MGLCFSKKQQEKPPPPPPNETSNGSKKPSNARVVVAEEKKAPQPKKAAKAEEPAADKKAVFVVKTAAAAALAKGGEEDRPVPEEEAKPVVLSAMPVRTSSCTKEEVDAILIQCGRLSRSSSGKATSSETGGGNRRYSGSKRSYDFDQERRAGGGGGDEECDWERQGVVVSRPSPHRRTPERKRSGSRERSGGGGGSRRVSRSPGRRAEGAPAAASSGSGERARQQPAKMVSVPAREKGRAPSPVAAASSRRCASPRSNSPARAAAAGNENVGAGPPTQTPSLSRSSSRKAEQSPYRRNPMAELDENTLRNSNNNNNAKPHKKSTENAVAVPQKAAERAKEQMPAREKPETVEETVAASDTKQSSAKTNATHSVSVVADSLNPRTGPGSRSTRSRRSSRDLDQNPNSYASLLLEDIQNYHQQNAGAAAPAFSLPACVSKACSIVEAVADLNSSSSENRSFEVDRSAVDKGSINGRYGKTGPLVVESEIVTKDDLMEPSLHKYVSVRDIRGEAEPQESAGSNSFPGNPWTCSWEPNSVDSTDRTWTASQSNNNGDDVEQGSTGTGTGTGTGTLSPLDRSGQSKQKPSLEPGVRPRAGAGSNVQRGRSAHRGSGSAASGRSGIRAVSATS